MKRVSKLFEKENETKMSGNSLNKLTHIWDNLRKQTSFAYFKFNYGKDVDILCLATDNWNPVFWGLNPTFGLNQSGPWSKRSSLRFSKLLSLIFNVKFVLKSITLGFGTIIKNGLPQIIPHSASVTRDYLCQTVSHNKLHLTQNHKGCHETPAHLGTYETGGKGRDYLIELHLQTHLMSHSFLVLLAGLPWPGLGRFDGHSRQRHAPWRGCWCGTENLLLILE